MAFQSGTKQPPDRVVIFHQQHSALSL
jgi:hypothetical protein